MRAPAVYWSSSDVSRPNNYLNNSESKVGGGGCDFHSYTGARQTVIGKIIPNPMSAGHASTMLIRERVRPLYMVKYPFK